MISSSIEDLDMSNSFIFIKKNKKNDFNLKKKNIYSGCFLSNIKNKIFNINKIYVGYSSDSDTDDNLKTIDN